MHKFTQPQMELARLIADGLTYDEIAAKLGISPRTAKSRTDRLRWILGVEKKRQIPGRMRALGLLKEN